jgi:CubicO group peptidase (beta-lactamase class C family)
MLISLAKFKKILGVSFFLFYALAKSAPSLDFGPLRNYVFSTQEGFQSNALLVYHEGTLVFEEYQRGFVPNQKQRLWSMTKSVAATLVGVALTQNLLDLNEKVINYFPEVKNKELSILHLLQMSSGIDWSETYESNPLESDVVAMLYYLGVGNMAKFTMQQDFAFLPGEKFNYSSGETNLLIAVLSKILAQKKQIKLLDFFKQELLQPLGISDFTWEQDRSFEVVGSSYLYMSLRDLAKIAQLYLNKGVWNAQTILSAQWIEQTTKVVPSFFHTVLPGFENQESYGLHWWLNQDLPEKKLSRPYPDAPHDMYFASGHHGQMMFILPTQKLILIRTGTDKNVPINKNEMLKKLLNESGLNKK